MAKLHELLAVDPDRSAVAEKIMAEAMAVFNKKHNLFEGSTRVLNMFDTVRADNENVTVENPLTTTVPDKLAYVAKRVAPHYDVLLQKEMTNQTARADVMVGGKVFMADVPGTFCLTMENRLKKLRVVYDAIPTLDPAFVWSLDADAGNGVWRQVKPTENMRTEKTLKHKVLVDSTDNHPAQVETWYEDVPIGKNETTRVSGMLTPADKAARLERIDDLIRAFKKARQRSNATKIVTGEIGKKLFAHIDGGK